MHRQLSANFHRLWRSSCLWLFLVGMLGLASAFMVIQYTAMDYSVPLSRVVFLPLSLYGMGAAAFVSVFVGTDFDDGFIRNKILTAKSRDHVVLAQVATSAAGCVLVYLTVTLFTWGVGSLLFENDVTLRRLALYLALGAGMSAAYGCIYCMVCLLCANKTRGIVWCMGLAMGLLFLSLHTNQVLVQTALKNGVPNPHYVSGLRRTLYGIAHDLNPCGQAAQLSAWNYPDPVRGILCNVVWVAAAVGIGCGVFRKKDLK